MGAGRGAGGSTGIFQVPVARERPAGYALECPTLGGGEFRPPAADPAIRDRLAQEAELFASASPVAPEPRGIELLVLESEIEEPHHPLELGLGRADEVLVAHSEKPRVGLHPQGRLDAPLPVCSEPARGRRLRDSGTRLGGHEAVASVADHVDEPRPGKAPDQKGEPKHVLRGLLDEGPALGPRLQQAHAAIEEVDHVARLAEEGLVLCPRQAKMTTSEYILAREDPRFAGDREQPAVRRQDALDQGRSAARGTEHEDRARLARRSRQSPGHVPRNVERGPGVGSQYAE